MKIKIEDQSRADIPKKWLDYKDGARFLVAGIAKPAFQRSTELIGVQLEQEIRGHRKVTDDTAIESALAYNKAAAHLILNWDGIADAETGDSIKYDHQTAEAICTSVKDESNALVVWLLDEAQKIQLAADIERVEVLGKSSSSTSIKTSSGTTKKRTKSSNARA